MPEDHYTGLAAVDSLRQLHGDTACWIVALGTNDVGLWHAPEYATVIRTMLDRIGPGHRVLWVNVFKGARPTWQAGWNTALEQVAAERPGELEVLDWAAIAAQHPEWVLSDQTHYTTAGYAARAEAIADASRALRAGTIGAQETPFEAEVLAPDGPSGRLVPLPPTRAIDTRGDLALTPGVPRVVTLADRVPAGAIAVAVNVAAVDPAAAGYLTAYPCDRDVPPTSNVNFAQGRNASSLAVVGVDGAARLCVLASAATDVLVDVTAAFVAAGGAAWSSPSGPIGCSILVRVPRCAPAR